MYVSINKTEGGTRSYPLHSHKRYEIMYYISGNGVMKTQSGDIPFCAGAVIIMPPNVMHGSVSDNDFVNISVECDFDGLLLFEKPTLVDDTASREGERILWLIYDNRYANESYLGALCVAYAQYLLQKIENRSAMSVCIREIMSRISGNALDPQINVSEILRQSGYAEDYVRACFKKEIGKTPLEFLSELRIRHACYLIDIYRDTLTLSEIAEKCGYVDYIYFSKKFKEAVGVSPRKYKANEAAQTV